MLKPNIVSTAPLYPYGEAWPNFWYRSDNLPSGLDEGLLHFRVSDDGRIIGQGAHSDFGLYYDGGKWTPLYPSKGINIGAFGPNGTVYVSTADGVRIFNRDGSFWKFVAGYAGANGIRFIKPNGQVVTGDETYAGLGGTIAQYTDCGGVLIGQGTRSDGAVVYLDGKLRWLINDGFLYTFIRANRVGDMFYIHLAREHDALAYRFEISLEELRTLPEVGSSQPSQPPAPTSPPVPPPSKEPMLEAPNKKKEVAEVVNSFPLAIRADEVRRQEVVNAVIARLGGFPWGRKAKSLKPLVLNTDALTYRRQDGLFEIYDIISGGADRGPTWIGPQHGPLHDGDNGYFYDVGRGNSDNTVPVVPTPEPPALSEADVNRIVGQAIGKALGALRDQMTQLRADMDTLNMSIHRIDLELDPEIEGTFAHRVLKPRTVRTTPNGFGPLKHSHEVTI